MKSLLNEFNPTTKQYDAMTKAERDYVRLQAEGIAQKVIQQNSGQPFLLRVVGAIIEAEGKRLEPKPEPADPFGV